MGTQMLTLALFLNCRFEAIVEEYRDFIYTTQKKQLKGHHKDDDHKRQEG